MITIARNTQANGRGRPDRSAAAARRAVRHDDARWSLSLHDDLHGARRWSHRRLLVAAGARLSLPSLLGCRSAGGRLRGRHRASGSVLARARLGLRVRAIAARRSVAGGVDARCRPLGAHAIASRRAARSSAIVTTSIVERRWPTVARSRRRHSDRAATTTADARRRAVARATGRRLA